MSRNRFLLDTDVLIDFLRGHPAAIAWIDRCERRPMVSVITIAELRAGLRAGEENVLAALLDALEPVSVTAEIAAMGGELRSRYRDSHGTGLADALIAACALHAEAILVTLNVRHFPMLEGLQAPYAR